LLLTLCAGDFMKSQPAAIQSVLLATLVAIVACNSNPPPSEPTPPIPNYAGTWSGVFQVLSCRLSVVRPYGDVCAALGSTQPFTLSLDQADSTLTGTLTFASGEVPQLAEISAAISPARTVFGIGTVVDKQPTQWLQRQVIFTLLPEQEGTLVGNVDLRFQDLDEIDATVASGTVVLSRR
jgi:hypothetical protein